MAKMLIAETSAVVVTRNKDGKKVQRKIRANKVYRDDDPVVQGREHLFAPVEDTTAAPGAKRSIGRGRRKVEEATESTESAEPTGVVSTHYSAE